MSLEEQVKTIVVRSLGPRGPRGLNWRSDWSSSADYVPYDAVTYNGAIYVSITLNTNTPPDLNVADWSLAVAAAPGGTFPSAVMQYKGDWDNVTTYQLSNVVLKSGNLYICVQANLNQSPPNLTYWIPFVIGAGSGAMVWKGQWASSAVYNKNDVVNFAQGGWVSKVDDNTGNTPTNALYWDSLSIGIGLNWLEPVADYAALLALTGNENGDTRITLDTDQIWVFNGTAWTLASGGGGAALTVTDGTTTVPDVTTLQALGASVSTPGAGIALLTVQGAVNLDGGNAGSTYGATSPIDGGGA